RYSLPRPGEPPPGPAPTVGSYLADTYARLTGAPLTDDRRDALIRRALGPRPAVAPDPPLAPLAGPRRSRLLGRLARAVLAAPEHRAAGLRAIAATALYRPTLPGLLRSRGPVESLRLAVLGSRAYLVSRAG